MTRVTAHALYSYVQLLPSIQCFMLKFHKLHFINTGTTPPHFPLMRSQSFSQTRDCEKKIEKDFLSYKVLFSTLIFKKA